MRVSSLLTGTVAAAGNDTTAAPSATASAGPGDTVLQVNTPRDLTVLSDSELLDLAQAVNVETFRRALAGADIDAVTEWGFQERFRSNATALPPIIAHGFVICAGSKVDRSATSHDCAWVAVGDSWIWETNDLITHVVRHPGATRPPMNAISLLVPVEGLELDFVESKMRAGKHTRNAATSYVVRGGELVITTSRSRPADHRN
jgi:hypothetical protein